MNVCVMGGGVGGTQVKLKKQQVFANRHATLNPWFEFLLAFTFGALVTMPDLSYTYVFSQTPNYQNAQ